MSAFEGFYKKEYINAGIILGANRKVEIKNAFNAGLEAAAEVADMEPSGVMANIVTAQNIAERIRELKGES